MGWWGKAAPEQKRVEVRTKFPVGIFVRTPEAVYFLRQDKSGKDIKFKLFSERVFQSWNAPAALATKDALVGFSLAGTLGFRDGTLIHNIADGRMYLVSASKRRHITSPDVFDAYGLDRSRMVEASDAETRLHEEGEPLN